MGVVGGGADAVHDSQGAFMLGDKTMVTHLASALEVVVEVIEFYSDGNRISGSRDASDIVGIFVLRSVCQQAEGIHNVIRHTQSQQIVESIVGILDDIMQESGTLLLGSLSGKSYRKGMQNHRVTVPVCLSGMGFESYFKTQLHDLVSCFRFFVLHIFQTVRDIT